MTGTLISNASDFPHTAVFEREGPAGAIYTIAFNNMEFGGWRQGLMAVAALVVLVLLIPGMIWLGQAGEAIGVSWVAGPVVVFGVFAGLIIRLKHPWKMKRAIELDFGADQLRVFKGQKLKISRQLSRMANLTVEDHPDAEHARITRQEHGKKSPKDVEKQHCLFGWLGAAFQRYQAMFGLLFGVPDAVQEQAERDRAEYGAAYIWIDKDGEQSFHYLMAVRFMVEVCGIPLREAWDAACENLENVVQENLPDAKAMALQLFRSQRNVLQARELARFLGDVYRDRYWRDVIGELESAALVPENSGLENWK